jgi:hypothetical protein
MPRRIFRLYSEIVPTKRAFSSFARRSAVSTKRSRAWIVMLKGIPRYSAAARAIVAGFWPKWAWKCLTPARSSSGTMPIAPKKWVKPCSRERRLSPGRVTR